LVALVVSVGASWQISRWVSRPIVGTIQAAEALSRGDWQQSVPESMSLELVGLSRAFNEMAQQLQGAFQKREYLATHDALTGLLNPTAFRKQLQDCLMVVRQTGRSLAVLFLDLDDFKFVNDHLGHLLGDELLVSVTQRLQQCLRDTDGLARFGGDEFVILLSPVESVTEAVHVASRLLAALQPIFQVRDHDIFIKASVGIVLSDGDSVDCDTPDSLLRQADIALYRAKSNGKARYECFDAAMQAEVSDRLALELELRQALDREEFEVYYQPIMTTDSGDVRGFEALVRWNSPTRGLVSPAQFIPLSEATGLILPLGEWVLTQACLQMQHWQQQFELFEGSNRWIMSVNLSGKQFAQLDVVEQVQRVLERTGLPAQALKLEITESLLVHNSQVSRAKLKAIRDLGVQLSLDDFGTGYSSLSYLHQFPFHTLKIDRSFIDRLQCNSGGGGEETDCAIVEAIIAMAHKLHMTVVAEGVETAEQWRSLQAMGCEQVQGYFFSRPKPAGDITALLEDRFLTVHSVV
jgi:diguanylate cyclase (GGDEF)-like protein